MAAEDNFGEHSYGVTQIYYPVSDKCYFNENVGVIM